MIPPHKSDKSPESITFMVGWGYQGEGNAFFTSNTCTQHGRKVNWWEGLGGSTSWLAIFNAAFGQLEDLTRWFPHLNCVHPSDLPWDVPWFPDANGDHWWPVGLQYTTRIGHFRAINAVNAQCLYISSSPFTGYMLGNWATSHGTLRQVTWWDRHLPPHPRTQGINSEERKYGN